MTDEAYHIIVTGMVQGVGFRYYTKEKADALALKGWVQNLSDGSVEIFVQGNHQSLSSFLEWCHIGPSSAKVQKLDYRPTQVELVSDFKIRR